MGAACCSSKPLEMEASLYTRGNQMETKTIQQTFQDLHQDLPSISHASPEIVEYEANS